MLTHTFKGSQLLQFIKKLVDHCLLLQYYSHQNAERPLSGSIASSAVYFPVNNIIHFTEVLNTLQVCLYCLIKDSLYSLFVHLFVVHLWKNTDVFFFWLLFTQMTQVEKGSSHCVLSIFICWNWETWQVIPELRSVTGLCAETVVTNFLFPKHDCQCRLWFNAAKVSSDWKIKHLAIRVVDLNEVRNRLLI